MLTCVDSRSIRSRLETSDLRPDESTTNIGLFKAGTGSILEYVDQPLLKLVKPNESFSAQPGIGAWIQVA